MRYVIALCVLTLAPAVFAGKIYRYVDEEGNVSYTSVRPPELEAKVEQVTLPPGPSEESRALAEQRENEIKEAGSRLTAEREEQAKARAQHKEVIQKAQKELEQAQRNLEQATSSRYGHGSARVGASADGVDLARKRLSEIRKRPGEYVEEYTQQQ